MLQKEIQVSQKLKVILDEDSYLIKNYSEMIRLIDQDKHPILNRYLSLLAK